VWALARHLLARRAKAKEHEAFELEASLFAGALGTALVWALGPCALGPALEVELGYLRARGDGDMDLEGKNRSQPWGSAQLGAVAAYDPYARFGLQLGLYAGTPLRRQLQFFAVEGDDEPIFTTTSITMRLALAARVSFGARGSR
jgi:hypothetical protein